MSTTEEIFLHTKEVFAKQATEAINEALERIYTEYLPHVESDTQSNVYFQTCEWLERFFADKLDNDDIKLSLAKHGWNAQYARQKIYEANKAEIIKAIGEDFEAEIQSLKEQLNAAYRRY